MGYRGRDIEVCEIDHTRLLVAACDSCGGIGEKAFDEIKVSAALVGRMTTRVAAMELIAVGAVPKIITIAISSEPNPTGVDILAGVEAELGACGFAELPRLISTEKNIETRQTGLGIGLTGICLKKDLKIGRSKPGDNVYCLGLPKVGNEIGSADDPDIIQTGDLVRLAEYPNVHDILPIGSRGILEETAQLAEQVSCGFVQSDHSFDVRKSAGPSTCAVFTCPDPFHETAPAALPVLTKIGCLISG